MNDFNRTPMPPPRRSRFSKGDKISDQANNYRSGGGGGGDEMEARVAKLESHVEYMRRDISDMKTDLKAVSSDLVSLKLSVATTDVRLAAIEKDMVTKGRIAVWALITLIAVGGSTAGGIWWMVQQYLGPILRALPK